MADDQLVLDLSAQPEYVAPFVRNSEWLWTLDQNPSGTYSSGTCILDTSSLSNSNKWLNWQSAYLAIPQRIRCTAGAVNLAMGQYMAGIKSGFHNTINSCQVELNGVTVQQSTQLSNLVWSYRLLTSMSYNDLIKYGSTIGFYPDDSNTWQYNAANSTEGEAATFSNNKDGGAVDVSAVAAGGTAVGYNRGFLQRQNWLSYNAAAATSHAGAASQDQLNQIFKPYVAYTAAAGGVLAEVIYNMIAIVRLRDICPLFAQLGLCKGLLVRLTMTLNQPTFTVTYAGAGGNITAISDVSFPYGGQSNPVMMASAAASNGAAGVGALTATVDLRVGTTAFSSALSAGGTANSGPFSQTNIRLWIQSCILAPEQEAELIANPIRRYHYHDVYEMDFAVAASGSVNQLLFNGVPRCRRLILIPLNDGGAANVVDGQGSGTTLPMAGLTNFQVYMSGMPLFPTPVAYDYRQYLEQFVKSGLNYGMVEGLSSGLIGQDQWENNYRYYVMDLHQGLESEDDVTKNLQVSFTSASAVAMRMYAFVEYQRELELNILSSAVISFK